MFTSTHIGWDCKDLTFEIWRSCFGLFNDLVLVLVYSMILFLFWFIQWSCSCYGLFNDLVLVMVYSMILFLFWFIQWLRQKETSLRLQGIMSIWKQTVNILYNHLWSLILCRSLCTNIKILYPLCTKLMVSHKRMKPSWQLYRNYSVCLTLIVTL